MSVDEQTRKTLKRHSRRELWRALLRLRMRDIRYRLVHFFAVRRNERACAWLVRRKFVDLYAAPRQRYVILLMKKAGLDNDVLAIMQGDPEVSVVVASRTDFQAIYMAFLPDRASDYRYLSDDPRVEDAKRAYRRFLAGMWSRIEASRRIDMVMGANVVYYAERELAAMCDARGIPFVVLQKENLKTPETSRRFVQYFRDGVGAFPGRRVLVYNEAEKQRQVAGGVCRPDQVEVVGMPRLDPYHRFREAATVSEHGSARPRVIYFLLMDQAALGRVTPDDRLAAHVVQGWAQLAAQTHRAVLEVARCAPDIDVLVKAKGIPGGTAAIVRLFGVEVLPPNLSIRVGGDPAADIVNSSVACAFNTTAMFEAIAAGLPVVSPRFAEAADPRFADNIVDAGDAVSYAESPQHLTELLIAAARREAGRAATLSDAACAALVRWVGNDDGRASERARQALRRELEGG